MVSVARGDGTELDNVQLPAAVAFTAGGNQQRRFAVTVLETVRSEGGRMSIDALTLSVGMRIDLHTTTDFLCQGTKDY